MVHKVSSRWGSGTLRQSKARRSASYFQKLGTSLQKTLDFCSWTAQGPWGFAHLLVQVLRFLCVCLAGWGKLPAVRRAGYTGRRGIAESDGSHIFNCLWSLHTVFPSGYTNMQYVQQFTVVSFYLSPGQHLPLVFLTIGILTGVT